MWADSLRDFVPQGLGRATVYGLLRHATHISGSTDLQDLVFRTIWQNPKRLKVKTTVDEIPVGFGDVLVRRDLLDGGAAGEQPAAYAVMTAAPVLN